MCNPNSSLASRKPRSVHFPTNQCGASSRTSSLLTQHLLGSMLRIPVHEATVDCGTKATMTTKAGCGLVPPPTLPRGSNGAPFASRSLQMGRQEKEKPKPKRRRKPQKPGKTAKQNDRHFVVHSYHDHADDHTASDSEEEEPRRRGGVSVSFPIKLHAVLDQVEMDGLAHVISWQAHGRAFVIHKPDEFVGHIMPHYFRQTKLTSFQRQLNLYGFNRLTTGKDGGGYYHELFLRGKEFLCKKMLRTKVKGTKFKAASSPEQEPNFYSMAPVVVTPPSTDYGSSSSDEECKGSNQRLAYGAVPTIPIAYESAPQAPPSFSEQFGYTPTWSSTLGVISPQFPTAFETSSEAFLDDAVDELFLNENPDESESIMDFVNVWNPANDYPLDTDAQLGHLLDRLLED